MDHAEALRHASPAIRRLGSPFNSVADGMEHAADHIEKLISTHKSTMRKADMEHERLRTQFQRIKDYDGFMDVDAFVVGCVLEALAPSVSGGEK